MGDVVVVIRLRRLLRFVWSDRAEFFILDSTELPVWPMYTLPYLQGLLCVLRYLRPKSCLMDCSNPEILRSDTLCCDITLLMWLKLCWRTAFWLLSRGGPSAVLYDVADWARFEILSGCIRCYEPWTGMRMSRMVLALFVTVKRSESSSLSCAAVLRLGTDSCGSPSCTCCDPWSSPFFSGRQKPGKALFNLKICRYFCNYHQFSTPRFHRSMCNKSARVCYRNNSTYTFWVT